MFHILTFCSRRERYRSMCSWFQSGVLREQQGKMLMVQCRGTDRWCGSSAFKYCIIHNQHSSFNYIKSEAGMVICRMCAEVIKHYLKETNVEEKNRLFRGIYKSLLSATSCVSMSLLLPVTSCFPELGNHCLCGLSGPVGRRRWGESAWTPSCLLLVPLVHPPCSDVPWGLPCRDRIVLGRWLCSLGCRDAWEMVMEVLACAAAPATEEVI